MPKLIEEIVDADSGIVEAWGDYVIDRQGLRVSLTVSGMMEVLDRLGGTLPIVCKQHRQAADLVCGVLAAHRSGKPGCKLGTLLCRRQSVHCLQN